MTQPTSLSPKKLIGLIIVATIALGSGIFFGCQQHTPRAEQMMSATLLPQPRTIAPFKLTDGKNQPFTQQNLQDHWTFLFFGFTHCQNICPMTMNVLNEMYQKIQTDQKPLPQIVLISLDPDRDTPKIIQKYVTTFNSNFQGATGNKKELDQLTKELSILSMKVTQPNATDMDYQIDHSGTLLLFDPKGELYAIFSMPHDATKIAQDFEKISG